MENGEVVRADVIGSWNNTVQIVGAYQLQLQSGGPLAAEDVLDDLADWYEALWLLIKGFHQTVMLFKRLKAQLTPSGTILGEYTWATPLAGVAAGAVAATTVTAPLSFLTTVPRVITRKSFGPVGEDGVNADGELNTAVLSDLADAASFLLATYVGTNGAWDYGYYSPKTSSFLTPFAAVYTVAPGTMARRRLGRGA